MRQSNGSSIWAMAVALAFGTALITMLPEVSCKRIIVGGSMGWTSDVNYTLWAANQTFYLNDWLLFIYDEFKDDVMEVNKTNYERCNGEHPINSFTTFPGKDAVTLNVTHDRYFINSKRSCYGGMKLHVHLTPLAPPPHLTPLPQPSHFTPLPSPGQLTPIPQPPRAAPSKSHSSRFIVLGIQLVIPIFLSIAAI